MGFSRAMQVIGSSPSRQAKATIRPRPSAILELLENLGVVAWCASFDEMERSLRRANQAAHSLRCVIPELCPNRLRLSRLSVVSRQTTPKEASQRARPCCVAPRGLA